MFRLAIAVFGLLLLAESAVACSCAWPIDFDEVEQDATRIFVGQLVGKNPLLSFTNNRYKFAVSETYTGDALATVTAWSPKWTPSCGIDVEKKKTYIVIAYKDGKRLWVSRCTAWIADHNEKMTEDFRNHFSSQENR